MKILHMITYINPSMGGPAYSVTRLAEEQAGLGHKVTLACLNYNHLGPQLRVSPTVRLIVYPGNLLAVYGSDWCPAFRKILCQEAHSHDVVHNHGLWKWPNKYMRCAAMKSGKPLVISPRGMLERWALNRSKIKKYFAGCLFERNNLKSARLFHATSESEAVSIIGVLRKWKIVKDRWGQSESGKNWEAGGEKQPQIVVAPNGVDVPEKIPGKDVLEKRFAGLKGKKWVVFMSRVHPKKGLLELARAWREVCQSYPGWELVIAGPVEDGKYADRVREVLKGEGVWTGELEGEAKWCALGRAEFVALPTFSENFGIVVAEALAAGRPVLTTTGTPWGAVSLKMKMKKVKDIQSMNLEERGCGVICEPGIAGVRMGLSKMLKISDAKREEMGVRGRKWMKEQFGWEKSAKELVKAYQRIV